MDEKKDKPNKFVGDEDEIYAIIKANQSKKEDKSKTPNLDKEKEKKE